MTQVDPKFGERHDREAVARLRTSGRRYRSILAHQDDIDGHAFYGSAEMRELEIIRNLHLDMKGTDEYLQALAENFFYFVSRETVDPTARLHARMMFYNGEDPATGSAAGCAAWMVAHGVAKPEERVLIEQGLEMKRPSRIFVRASREDWQQSG